MRRRTGTLPPARALVAWLAIFVWYAVMARDPKAIFWIQIAHLVVTVINVVLFIGIFSRMIPFQALMSQVPAQTQRGSFNAINASISQLAGGLASLVAGHIVQQGADGRIHHYDIAGYVVVATSLMACVLLWRIHAGSKAILQHKLHEGHPGLGFLMPPFDTC